MLESQCGGQLLWRVTLHASDWVGARNKPLLSHSEQLFLNFNVHVSHLKISLKCRF